MADNALSSFKTEHHYVAGMVLVAIGLVGFAGSVTGRLAAMLAGLFCNQNGLNTALVSPPNQGFNPGTKPTTQITTAPGKSTAASNLPGRPGNPVSP